MKRTVSTQSALGLGYRAIGRLVGAEIVWFWIGPHQEYDKRI